MYAIKKEPDVTDKGVWLTLPVGLGNDYLNDEGNRVIAIFKTLKDAKKELAECRRAGWDMKYLKIVKVDIIIIE
jgi:hypothetical protein